MSVEIIRRTSHIARKAHVDDAGLWIRHSLARYGNGLSFAEWRHIVSLKQNGWKIVPGQRYDRYAQICDGDFGEFKCLPEIHRICLDHDLYPD